MIHYGGKKVLHVGDAEARRSNFEAFDLSKQKIDVAILPVWMFQNKALVEQHIAAKHYIAAHLPVQQTSQIKQQLAESHPDVLVPARPMQEWTFE